MYAFIFLYALQNNYEKEKVVYKNILSLIRYVGRKFMAII
jgi:hypothetical protein